MTFSARGHKAVVALLQRLERDPDGKQRRPVVTMFRRHRLAFTLLVIGRGGVHGAGGGGSGPAPEVSDAIEEFIDILEEQQEALAGGHEDHEGHQEGTGSQPSPSGPTAPAAACALLYKRYQDAVQKKNYLQANKHLKAYQACLRANAN